MNKVTTKRTTSKPTTVAVRRLATLFAVADEGHGGWASDPATIDIHAAILDGGVGEDAIVERWAQGFYTELAREALKGPLAPIEWLLMQAGYETPADFALKDVLLAPASSEEQIAAKRQQWEDECASRIDFTGAGDDLRPQQAVG